MGSFSKATAAGVAYGFLGFIDSNGFFIGGSTSAPAAGSSSGMIRIRGIQTASPTVPEPDTVQIPGDDELISEFDFPSIASRRFNIDVAVGDLDLEALVQGTNVQTLGEFKYGALDITAATLPNAVILLEGNAKKQNQGVVGQAAWTGTIIPLCTVRPLGRVSINSREGAAWRLSVTPQLAGYYPWGITMTDSNAGADGMRQIPLAMENPVHLVAFTGNASAAEFTLDYTPISVAKTSIIVNRVVGTTASVNTSTKTATVTATPPSSARGIIAYEFSG